LQKIENRGYIEIAKRTKSIISRVYEYANILNLTNINPTTGLSRILKNKKSENFPFVKKVEDIRHLMFDINNYQRTVEVQLALKIAGELRFARWHELEGDMWRIPAERTKLKREHLVPLSIQVKALFKQLNALNHDKKYIFCFLF
jgi:integrase